MVLIRILFILILKTDSFILDDCFLYIEGDSSGGGSGGGPSKGGPPGGRPPESSSQDLPVSEGNKKRKEDLESAVNDLKEIANQRTNIQLSEGKIQEGAEAVRYYNSQLKSVLNESVKEIASESKKNFVEVEDYRALHGRIDRIINSGHNR